ncbi:hypothetical protein HHK36_019687 [Tetracentron sinense]|uniref:Uncharacterized protein n=1 Tax=Tetracentron sinense TaxID=13715 RepID=A0A834Z1S6_TETSI|nr:hypothetical protein HHK36_019687 [Tetracentron sinense]
MDQLGFQGVLWCDSNGVQGGGDLLLCKSSSVVIAYLIDEGAENTEIGFNRNLLQFPLPLGLRIHYVISLKTRKTYMGLLFVRPFKPLESLLGSSILWHHEAWRHPTFPFAKSSPEKIELELMLQAGLLPSYTGMYYSLDHEHQFMKPGIEENSGNNNTGIVDYMLNNPPPQQPPSGFCGSTSLDRLSFPEVLEFTDFGPKLALNQDNTLEKENGVDPVYLLKFPVLGDKLQNQTLMFPPATTDNEEKFKGVSIESKAIVVEEEEGEDEEARMSKNTSVQLHYLEGSL